MPMSSPSPLPLGGGVNGYLEVIPRVDGYRPRIAAIINLCDVRALSFTRKIPFRDAVSPNAPDGRRADPATAGRGSGAVRRPAQSLGPVRNRRTGRGHRPGYPERAAAGRVADPGRSGPARFFPHRVAARGRRQIVPWRSAFARRKDHPGTAGQSRPGRRQLRLRRSAPGSARQAGGRGFEQRNRPVQGRGLLPAGPQRPGLLPRR